VLVERRFTLPLQALEPVDLDGSGAAVMMLLNPTGGILGGDALDTSVTVGADAHVCLTTPAATRVYRSAGAPAVQRFTALVGEGATLEYLPDHLIPSPGARLHQTTDVTLADGATLLLADAWAVGRVARGERWRFGELDLGLAVRDTRGLVLKERCRLVGSPRSDETARLDGAAWLPAPPAWTPAREGLGGTEGFGYVATFVAAATHRRDWQDIARELCDTLAPHQTDARVAVSALGRSGVLARLLCPSAPVLSAAIGAVWTASRRRLLGLRPLCLRKL